VVNDDSLSINHQSGIRQLSEALESQLEANIVVVAPFEFQVHPSFSITSHEDCTAIKQEDWGKNIKVYAVLRTPIDCIKFAFGYLFRDVLEWHSGPDLVVSGINCGANLGTDLLYSGTIAAAFGARFERMNNAKYSPPPALAISLCQPDVSSHVSLEHYWNFDNAIKVAINLASVLLDPATTLPDNVIWNVNVPHKVKTTKEGLFKVAVTKPGLMVACGNTITNIRHTKKRNIEFRIGTRHERTECPGTDCTAINKGFVSLTPLKLTPTLHCPYEASQALATKLERIKQFEVQEVYCYDPMSSRTFADRQAKNSSDLFTTIIIPAFTFLLGATLSWLYQTKYLPRKKQLL